MLTATLLLALGLTTPADLNKTIQEIDFEQLDINKAMQSLGSLGGIDIQVLGKLEGEITMTLRKVPLRFALYTALKQVDSTYELREGKVIAFNRDNAPSKSVVTIDWNNKTTSKILDSMFGDSKLSYRMDAFAFRDLVRLGPDSPWADKVYQEGDEKMKAPLEFALAELLYRTKDWSYRVERHQYVIYKASQ